METAKAPATKEQPANPAFEPVIDIPTLPRVLLIGDSISIGYTLAVRELLTGKANVHRIPENGGPTIRGLEKIDEWLGDGKWDVIHFNWGLHDLKYMEDGKHQVSLPEYRKNLDKMVKRMKRTKAVLIWASTTPVPEGEVSPHRVPGDVLLYNETARAVMRRERVAIDDLYGFALPRLKEIQRPVNVHFTDEGSKALAVQVVASIERELARSKR